MRFTRATTDGTHAVQQIMCGEQAVGSGHPRLAGDLFIHVQADEVVRSKQARDMWQDKHAERTCGCPQCRRAYKGTLVFYANLGIEQPAHERVRTGDHAWFAMSIGRSLSEHGEEV